MADKSTKKSAVSKAASVTDTKATRAAKSAAAKAAATARRRATNNVENGFLAFVREQGVVGLAVGLVIGTQVKLVVDQLIASFVNPILGLILPGQGDLSQKKFSVTVSELDNKTAVFAWGQFVYVLISFLVVAAIIYHIIKGLKLDKIDKKKE